MKNRIKDLSEDLHLSRPTVSRALRHCAGVDSETRALVLERARDGLPDAPPSAVDLYAILPDVPRYFWGRLFDAIGAEWNPLSHPAKFNVYTRLGDEGAVLHYLSEAETLDARVLLLSARITPAIAQRLTSLAKSRLVLLLSEFSDLLHTFYVGADPVSEGYALGRAFCDRHRDEDLLLLMPDGCANAPLRITGFLRACEENSHRGNVLRLSLAPEMFATPKLFPAKLAAHLARSVPPKERLCLYAPTAIPQLSLALSKAKLTAQVQVLTHDSEILDARFFAVCQQNVEKQAHAAVCAIRRYLERSCCPDAKFTYVPSNVYTEVTS